MRRPARLPPERLATYVVEAPHPRAPDWRAASRNPQPLDWRAIFGNDRPVEVEVGFGKGLFLLSASSERPAVNFFGIELERKYVVHTAARLAKRNVANVRLACTDARWLLQQCVLPASVQAIHVYFPDPWWKHRHQKRKVLTPAFSAACARSLSAAGILHLATDVEEYFRQACDLLTGQEMLQRLADECQPSVQVGALTNFERKYRADGRPIYRARFIKS